MKVAIIAAAGKAGHLILEEAVKRGMDVTAIVRHKEKITNPNVKVLEKDLFDLTFEDLQGQDVVVDAFNAPQGKEELHQSSLAHLIDLLKGHEEIRLMVVGGAGSLYVDPEKTTRLMDTKDFPEVFLPTASNMGKAFDELKATTNLNWTYISPSAFFNPDGAATGSYQVGTDNLLTNAKGESEISFADYALGFVDEMEKGEHLRERITLASK
ncbi:NAD(P)-dependent oxidoreductase [Listeria kieliensis]